MTLRPSDKPAAKNMEKREEKSFGKNQRCHNCNPEACAFRHGCNTVEYNPVFGWRDR